LPDSGDEVNIEVAMEPVCLSNGHLPTKHVLCNRMRPFRNVKRGNWRTLAAPQLVVGCTCACCEVDAGLRSALQH
jgi:hypothetical protein